MEPTMGPKTQALAKRVEDLGYTFAIRYLPLHLVPRNHTEPVRQYGVGLRVHQRTFWSLFGTLKELDRWVTRMEAELRERL